MVYTNSLAITELEGIVKEVTEPIISTMGPRGSNVMRVHIKAHPSVTKDGVSVAVGIRPITTGTFSEGVINLVLQACDKTRTQIGDGTTTTALIVRNIVSFVKYETDNYITDKLVRFELKDGIELATKRAVEEFKNLAIDATKEDLDNNLYISMNNNTRLIDMLKQIDIVNDRPIIVHADNDMVNKENKPSFHASTLTHVDDHISGEYKCLCMDYKSLLDNYDKLNPNEPLIVFTTDDNDFKSKLSSSTIHAEMVTKYILGMSHILPIILHGDDSKRFDNPLSKLVDVSMVVGCDTIVSYGNYEQGILTSYGTASIDSFIDDKITFGNKYERPEELVDYLELLKSSVTSAEDSRLLDKRIINLTAGKPLLAISGTKAEYKEAYDILDDGISAYRAITKYNKVVIGAGNTQYKAGLFIESDKPTTLTDSQSLGYDAVVYALKGILDRLVGCDFTHSSAVEYGKEFGLNLNGDKENLYKAGIVESLYGQERSLINGANTASQLLTLEYCLVDMKKN